MIARSTVNVKKPSERKLWRLLKLVKYNVYFITRGA